MIGRVVDEEEEPSTVRAGRMFCRKPVCLSQDRFAEGQEGSRKVWNFENCLSFRKQTVNCAGIVSIESVQNKAHQVPWHNPNTTPLNSYRMSIL